MAMTDGSTGVDGLMALGRISPEMQLFVQQAMTQLHSLNSELRGVQDQLAVADRRAAELDAQLLSARQHIRQLQLLLDSQADRLERHRGTDERIAALADFAEWASESRYGGPPASVLVTDLRRAVSLTDSDQAC
jgi:septal ring factor EnvC (AmiA/AmiB activator)